ncbi:MAG: NAD(P)-dependent oxidoreductase, partial [Armatimonadaceae bacterium]
MIRGDNPVRVVWKTDRGRWHQERTRRAAPEGVHLTMIRGQDPALLLDALADADVLVSERTVAVEAWEVENAPNLGLLLRLGSLPDRLPLDTAVARGIPVCMEPVPLCAVCAEHALMLALALLRGYPKTNCRLTTEAGLGPSRRTDEDTFAYNWTKRPSLGTLRGSDVGILGMGGIGAEIVFRLRGFGPSSVRYTKRTPFSPSIEEMLGARADSPENVLSGSDVIFCLLPYGPET